MAFIKEEQIERWFQSKTDTRYLLIPELYFQNVFTIKDEILDNRDVHSNKVERAKVFYFALAIG